MFVVPNTHYLSFPYSSTQVPLWRCASRVVHPALSVLSQTIASSDHVITFETQVEAVLWGPNDHAIDSDQSTLVFSVLIALHFPSCQTSQNLEQKF
jgi:hypothetical protein